MRPKAFLPFAGAYVLGGKERYKNEFLGTATWDECADYVRKNAAFTNVIVLREGDEYSFETDRSNRTYVQIDVVLLRFSGELIAHSRPAISKWTGLW